MLLLAHESEKMVDRHLFLEPMNVVTKLDRETLWARRRNQGHSDVVHSTRRALVVSQVVVIDGHLHIVVGDLLG